ncbi:hypothetical protein AQI96_32360 [Streptomyces canus]|nr:hypothetical protein AQI96_32360 [Streptomyces canus]
MTACPLEDLRATADAGLHIAYSPRPLEWGPGHPDPPVPDRVDLTATDIPGWPDDSQHSARPDASGRCSPTTAAAHAFLAPADRPAAMDRGTPTWNDHVGASRP